MIYFLGTYAAFIDECRQRMIIPQRDARWIGEERHILGVDLQDNDEIFISDTFSDNRFNTIEQIRQKIDIIDWVRWLEHKRQLRKKNNDDSI